MNDNAAMLVRNITPIMMARIPIMILKAVNPVRIIAIPKNIRLNPMKIDTVAVPKTGKIRKINPKIMASIPDVLFGSIFFPPICSIHFFTVY
jgi:hypothetical protein